MKKFFRFLLVLILIVGGCAAYFFLANNKMMVSVVKSDKDALLTTLNNSIKKVHDYGNFNFSYQCENKTANTKQTSQVLIKFDGENRYFSAEVTEIVDGETTNHSYYCEANGDVATLYEKSGDEKKKFVTTWNLALGKVMEVPLASVMLLENDYVYPKEDFDKYFKSSEVTFSTKPFYYGAKIELQNDENNLKIDVSNRGILRKIECSGRNLLNEYSLSLTVNKPGKAVSIKSLSDTEKDDYKLSII